MVALYLLKIEFFKIKKVILFILTAFLLIFFGMTPHSALFGLLLMLFCSELIAKNEHDFVQAVKYIFILNFFFSIMQVLGVANIFYFHLVYYEKPTIYYNLLDLSFFSEAIHYSKLRTPQLRPAGIFFSTIYFSFFHILFLSIIFYSKSFKSIWYVLFGFSAFISGSTVIIFLGIFSLFLAAYNKKFIFPFLTIVPLIVIFYNFQKSWLMKNYGIKIHADSFSSRGFDFFYFYNNLLEFYPYLLILYLMIIFVFRKSYLTFIRYSFFLVVIIIPVMLHNLYSYSGYLVLLGILYEYNQKKPGIQ